MNAVKRPAPWAAIICGLLSALLTFTSPTCHARRTGPPRLQAITLVVIHSTGGPTCQDGHAIWVKGGELEDNLKTIEAHPKLGIHYMIDRDGTLRASVPEQQIAHHVFHYSRQSLAIELINDGDGLDPFPEAQIQSLVQLLRDLTQRHPIPRTGIKRHSDLDHGTMPCAPTRPRKIDPGPAFPFQDVLERVFAGR